MSLQNGRMRWCEKSALRGPPAYCSCSERAWVSSARTLPSQDATKRRTTPEVWHARLSARLPGATGPAVTLMSDSEPEVDANGK